jgi:hypothetical protein
VARNLTKLGVFVLALPIAIEVPDDSSESSGHATRVSIGGGVGTYALIARNCEGNAIGHTPVDFRDVGAAIDRQIVGPWHVGIRGGVLHDKVGLSGPPTGFGAGTTGSRTNWYANPYLSAEGRGSGFGGGWVYSDQPIDVESGRRSAARFSGHIRLGGRERYFSLGVMENVPLYSGGGFTELGIGFRPHPAVDSWVGLSGGPFDGAGAALKADWRMNPRMTLDMRARLGRSGEQPQLGIAVGVTSRLGGATARPVRQGAAGTRDSLGQAQER